MREILFRGKTYGGEWVQGDLNHYHSGSGIFISECEAKGDFCKRVNPETVGQYTGLTDRNGSKIFEGDILKHYYDNTDKSMFDIGVILFDDEVCQFKRNSRVNTRYYNIHFECEYEVIGNIHDNPELLKGEEENA